MSKQKYSDEGRLEKFLESFHHMSDKDHWPKIREWGRVDILSDINFHVDRQTGLVSIKKSLMSEENSDIAAANMRKFISGGDSVALHYVITSAENLGAGGLHFNEAKSVWKQAVEKNYSFIVWGGKSIGMRLDALDQPIWWNDTECLIPLEFHQVDISLKDCTEVFFNEGLFHPYEPGRNERVRAIARSIPKYLQRFMVNVAISASIYCAIILHHQIGLLRPEWSCDKKCQEQRIFSRNN